MLKPTEGYCTGKGVVSSSVMVSAQAAQVSMMENRFKI
jgi:hypothetical protein